MFSTSKIMPREQLIDESSTKPYARVGEHTTDEFGNEYEYLKILKNMSVTKYDCLCQSMLAPDADFIAEAQTPAEAGYLTLVTANLKPEAAINLTVTTLNDESAKDLTVIYEDLDGERQTSDATAMPDSATTEELGIWATKIVSVYCSAATTGNITVGFNYSRPNGACPISTTAEDDDCWVTQVTPGAAGALTVVSHSLDMAQEITLTAESADESGKTVTITYVDEDGDSQTSSAIALPNGSVEETTEGTGLYARSITSITVSAATSAHITVGKAARTNIGSRCAIAMAAVTATASTNQYIWGLVKTGSGQCTGVRVAASCTAAKLLQATSSGGVLDDSDTDVINGIVLMHPQKSSAGTNYSGVVNFPYFGEKAA